MCIQSEAHPSLEILEDRYALAGDALGAAPITPQLPAAAAALQPAAQVGSTPSQSGIVVAVPAAITGNQAGVARVLITGATDVGNPTSFVSLSTAPVPGIFATAGATQPDPAQEYTGRVVLAGTGVQERAASGTGPLTQPPGLYLLGGAGDSSAVPEVRPVRPMQVPLMLPGGEAVAGDQTNPDAPANGEDAALYAAK